MNIWTIVYSDDVVLLSNNEEVLKKMVKGFTKYLKLKGLELNIGKSKVMVFRKARGRRKTREFKWDDEKLEIVTKFCYLGHEIEEKTKTRTAKKTGERSEKNSRQHVKHW